MVILTRAYAYEKLKQLRIYAFSSEDDELDLRYSYVTDHPFDKPQVYKCVTTENIRSRKTIFPCNNQREIESTVNQVEVLDYEPVEICDINVYGIIPGKLLSTTFIYLMI